MPDVEGLLEEEKDLAETGKIPILSFPYWVLCLWST